ncbi:MAG: energy-coupled thiamine transporter ThiT [Clostridia bacterium]|nr:energy-coupled thiamine transporter ThiT [Clostridia bacterium]
MNTTKKLTTSALLIALATVLMWVSKLIPAPWLQGGSVTLASMVPIIAAGILFGTKWGLCCSLAYAVLQMIFGFYPPPTQTFSYFFLVIVLDYVLAFGVLGLSGFFYRISGKRSFSAPLSAFLVTLLRYICHIISGILIWGVYAEKGQTVLAYSLIYNGTYMIPEIVISTAVTAIIFRMKLIKK